MGRGLKALWGKRSFLFDLDGTLVDSSALHAWAFEAALRSLAPDLALHFNYATVRGQSTPDAFVSLGVRNDAVRELVAEKRRVYRDAVDAGQLKAMPGVLGLLALLNSQKRELFIVTSASRLSSARSNEASGIAGFIGNIITSEDVERGKPHPDILVTCMERFALHKDDCVVVEDADDGLRAAMSAGLETVAVFDPAMPSEATWRFPDLCTLFDALRHEAGMDNE